MTRLALVASLLLYSAVAVAQQHDDHDHASHADQDHAAHEADPAHGEDAHAGDHGHGASVSDVTGPIEFWGAVVNFGLLIVVLVVVGRKPMASFLSNRRRGVEEGLAEAQRMKAQAEAKHAEYSERLEQLDREIEEIRHEMVKAGEAERDRIVAEAEAKAARMRRETDFLIEQQMKQLKVDLTREAVEAAVDAAEKVLREKTDASDQQRLAQAYLERLDVKASSGGNA